MVTPVQLNLLLPTPWWRWQTIPGLSFANFRLIAEAQGRPLVERVVRVAFRKYRLLRLARLGLRLLWLIWLLVAASSGTFPVLVEPAGWAFLGVLLLQVLYWLLKKSWAETVAADRVVQAVANASSSFERPRPLDPAETRRFVVDGTRFSRAVFAALSGSRWFALGHPGSDDSALRVASLAAWTAPDDFRSLTHNERTEQLASARLLAAFIVARDFQGAALVAENAKACAPELFLGAASTSSLRDRHFEAFGPGLLNTRLRFVTSVLPWAALFVSTLSLAVTLVSNLMRAG